MSDLTGPFLPGLSELVDALHPVTRSRTKEQIAAEKRARQDQAATRRRRKAEKRAIAESRRQAKRGKARRKQGRP